jgi:glycolate oxidase iron-sulfur subunit
MEAVKNRTLELDDEAAAHLDGCLGCLACETACPSGVSFHERIEEFRPRLRLPPRTRVWRTMIARTSTSPTLLRAARMLGRVLDRAGLEGVRRITPGLCVLPRSRSNVSGAGLHSFMRTNVARPGRPRARVALLEGCAASVLAPEIHAAAVQVLRRNGVEVVEPPGQGCCGALALHGGRPAEAATLARRNASVFAAAGADYVVTTAAGCGAMLRDYGRLLDRDPLADAARSLARTARDISEVLCELGIEPPARTLSVMGEVAYHDACHLLHAARVASPPRRLVEAAIGKEPVDLGENNICCGSAGSYSLDKPAIARLLGQRKAELASERNVAAIAVANVGCILQIELALALQHVVVPVLHPVEFLAEAYARADAAGA